jgi:hypothetical protein
MAITANRLTQAAAVCAALAGAIFIGVNINHPHVDLASITTTELVVRNSLKVLMCALALAGITGMYLSQVRRNGVVGLVGYLVLGIGYLLIMSTTFVSAYVLPAIADTDPTYVEDVIAVTTGGTATADIGALAPINQLQGFAYLAGGLLFGIALYRARVLARWAAALLAVGGVVSAALAVMPDAFYRLLAYPNGIAMLALGYSLWSTARRDVPTQPAEVGDRHATTTGGEATA